MLEFVVTYFGSPHKQKRFFKKEKRENTKNKKMTEEKTKKYIYQLIRTYWNS